MRKRWKVIVSIIIVFAVAVASQIILNREYLTSDTNSTSFNVQQVQLNNWIESGDDEFASLEDGQIIINCDSPTTVKQVEFIGEFDNEIPLTPTVYYQAEDNTEFLEEFSLQTKLKDTKSGYRINLALPSVTSLRIDLNETAGLNIRLTEIKVHHNIFQIWVLALLLSITLSILGVILLNIPLNTYKNLPNQWENFKKYRFLLQNLVKKDITTKYRRSVLGILWSVLNPLLMMMVITAVFQTLFRSNIENFPIYYLTGSLIFNFTVESTNASMTSMIDSAPLIKKVYIPKYIFPMEKTLFALVNMVFSLIAVIIIYIVLRFTPPVTVLLFPVALLYVFMFCLGFGMILATLNVFFRDISHLYGVWTTAWVYLTPIMYPMDILPAPVLSIVKMNPLYYYVEYFRNIMMYGIVPSFRDNLICLFFSVSFLLAGFLIFKRNQDKFILHI